MNPVTDQPSPESILLTPLQMRIVQFEAGSAVASVDLHGLPGAVVRSPNHINTPRKRRSQIKLHIRPVDKRLAGVVRVGAQHGIVEACARVVRIDIEVVVGGVVAGSLQVESLGSDGFGVGGAGDEGGGCGDGGQERGGERGEESHIAALRIGDLD